VPHPSALLLALVLALAACTPPGARLAEAPASGTPAAEPGHALVLISIDGFRHDYGERAATPTLERLASEGVRTERMIPVFPTLTFPNHYSLVTGLHPERHGIVGNTMYDPDFDAAGEPAWFSLGNRDAVGDGRWWGGEPLWVTAERQGRRTATMFWPGSEAEIGGTRPSTWLDYDGSLPHSARIDSVLTWLDRPAETRPAFITLYFSSVDSEGHRHGPDAPEVTAALEGVDTALARLVAGLEARSLLDRTDLIVTTDHGMAALDPERIVFLDEYVDLDADVERVTWGAVTGLWPAPGRADAVVRALRERAHFQAWHREDVPERFHFRGHRRIAPVVLLANEGWTLSTRANTEQRGRPSGGTHGFDPELDSMAGVFLARGPSFRSGGAVVRPVAAVDLYNVMAQALGLTPAPNDGDPEVPGLLLAR
jgi:predicted AlkP superfamily pyrophosphatase or phosphodiesterase